LYPATHTRKCLENNYPHPPDGWSLEISRGWGGLKGKESIMKLNWHSRGGGGGGRGNV